MTDYLISVSMVFDNPDGATDDDFQAFIDAAVVAFGEINDADLSVCGSHANRTADFSAILPGTDAEETLARYVADLHLALHRACCPVWPWFGVREQTVREFQPA